MSDLFVKAVKDYKKRVIRDFLIWDLIMLITAPVYAFCVEGGFVSNFWVACLTFYGGLTFMLLLVSAIRYCVKIEEKDIDVSKKKFNMLNKHYCYTVFSTTGDKYSVEGPKLYKNLETGKSYKCLIQGCQIIHIVASDIYKLI